MPVLKNPKHERFAQAVATGSSGAEAYRKHVSGGKCSNATAEVTSCQMLRDGSKVALRVSELREELAERSKEKAFLSFDEKRNFFAMIVRTPIGEIDHTSPLCQERTYIVGQEEDSVKVKMPDKLRAIQLDNDLAVDGAEAGKNKALEIVIRKL